MTLLRCAPVLLGIVLSTACDAPTYRAPDVPAQPVAASFTLQMDADHPALERATRDPSSEPVTIEGESDRLRLHAYAKTAAGRPGYVWLDLFIENLSDIGLRDVEVRVDGESVRDWTNDPFTTAEVNRLSVGRIAPEGIGRLSIGVSEDRAALALSIDGVDTTRTSSSSAPIAVTPDGSEVWTTFPDADVVAVLDTATNARLAQVDIPGRPSSLAITPDGMFVLVASARGNAVSVIDRAERRVVQRFEESDGVAREPRHLVVTPDGSRAFVSAYVDDRVVSLVRRGDEFSVEGSVAVGRRPAGLSVTPDSQTVLVSHFLPRGNVSNNEGWITVLGAEPLEVIREVTLKDHFNVDEAACIADVFGVSPSRLATEGVPTQLAGVFLDPAGNEGWTPGTRAAGSAIAWEASDEGRSRYETLVAIRPGELSPPFVFIFDTREAEATEPLQLGGALERPVAESYVDCARYTTELEFVGHDDIPSAPGSQVNRFLAFPAGVSGLTESGIMRHLAFTRGGRRALMVSYVADEIVVNDAATHHPASRFHFLLEGHNPVGIAVAPDGQRAYVAYANSTFVSVLDISRYATPGALPGPSYVPYEFTEVPDVSQVGVAFMSQLLVRHFGELDETPPIAEIAQIPVVDEDPMDAQLRQGAILFDSANPRREPTLSQSSNGACASCHPDGGTDGTMWGTMEGERRTMSLRGGVAGRGWLHASGTHRDIHEFVEVVAEERLGAAMTDEQLDAISSWIARGIPRLQTPTVDEALAARGAGLFATYCVDCHQGEMLTSGAPDPGNRWGGGSDEEPPELFDIGTAVDQAGVILGTFFESLLPEEDAELLSQIRGDRVLGTADPVQDSLGFRARPDRERGEFKAPSLVNVWDNVLYFHDGRFTSPDQALDYLNRSLELGLDEDDRRALVEYLRTL